EAVQIQTDRLQDSLQRENDEFLSNIDENMKKVLKELVKNQVKEQVSRILPRIEESVNATLEAEVLTLSSQSSRTSYAIAADLSEMELKKILIEKMEGNKSIQRSDEQQNIYKALVEAYEVDKAILDTYGDSTILKRRREDDDQEGPSAGPNRGSKRQKEGGEQASASTPSEKETKGTGGSTTGSQSRQRSASESAYVEEPVQTTCQMEETLHPVFDTEVSNFIMHRLNRSDEQRNLYKALVEAYEVDKTILDTYGDSSILKKVEKMMIKKDPPLDQTGGPKDKKKEVSRHQLALPLKKQPRLQADLQQGLSLDNSLPVSLLMQRNLCRLLVRWRKPHFW
nr:hypothetical protein [Tanacetum cinerariifolium]